MRTRTYFSLVIFLLPLIILSCSDDNPTDADSGITVNITYTPGATTGTLLHFSATYSGAALNDALYVWNYGDGSPSDSVENNQYSGHTFPSAGKYTVLVSIYDHVTGTLHAQGRMELSVTEFISGFSLSVVPASAFAGDSISFAVINTGDAVSNALYEWDFGDGSSVTNRRNDSIPVHVYEDGGSYTVTCKVYEDKTNILRATLTRDITISLYPYPDLATYMRLSIHGEFVYHRYYSNMQGAQIDSMVTLDSISTRVLRILGQQSESMVWSNNTLSCTVDARLGIFSKYLSLSVMLSKSGSSINTLVLNGILTHDGGTPSRTFDTLNVIMKNIPLEGAVSRRYARYRISGQEYQNAITHIQSSIRHREVTSTGYDDVLYLQNIVPNSDGYIEVELYQEW